MISKAHDSCIDNPTPVSCSAPFQQVPPVRITLASAYTGVPLPTLRELRFYSQDRLAADGSTVPGNGFAPAFLTLGRAVYVDIPVFLQIWRSQRGKELRND